MPEAPTPRQAARLLPTLLRRVPVKVRGWVYLALLVAAIGYIAVTAWRSGLSSDQLIALALAVIGALAKSNTGQAG